MKKIIAICGSTRISSTNLHFIQAISMLVADSMEFSVVTTLGALPHFNPDLDTENPPEQVLDFRCRLKAADGILICTPEYAMGVPGTLKNAIDWTVSSMEFSNKPTALVTASSMGEKGHASLLETLKVLEARIIPETQLLIPFARTKISNDRIVHDQTLEEVQALLRAFDEIISGITVAE